jgi:hypothetical protein
MNVGQVVNLQRVVNPLAAFGGRWAAAGLLLGCCWAAAGRSLGGRWRIDNPPQVYNLPHTRSRTAAGSAANAALWII